MRLLYILATLFLLINFLRLKKSNKKISLVSELVYSFGLLICYNITIVFILSYLNIRSSFVVLSIVSTIIGGILLKISIKKKEKQEYNINKKEIISLLIIIFLALSVGLIRFNGLTEIHYESGDSAIHYKHASYFSKEHMLLTKNNSQDTVYGDFNRAMNASYINGGLLIDLFPFMKPHFAFILFDILMFCLAGSLFLVTTFKLLENKDNKYLYCIVLSILYLFSFPLNNMLFGFYYLGLGIIIINLLLYKMININLNNNKLFNIILITMITFGVFNSYYLFMPPIYLGLGIYYIYNFLKKKINFKTLFIYGVITLMVPFIIGFCYYLLPSLIDDNKNNFFTVVKYYGYIYENILILVPFGLFSLYLLVTKQIKEKILNINYYSLFGYMMIFLILLLTKSSEYYYFYKLFYLYYLIMFLILSFRFYNKKIFVYGTFIIVVISCFIVILFNGSTIANKISSLNIYDWNINRFYNGIKIFDAEELDIIEHSNKYRDECTFNNELLLANDNTKNLWYYSITGMVPIPNHITGFGNQIQHGNVKFVDWEIYPDHKCIIYFYPRINKFLYDSGKAVRQVSLYKEDVSQYNVLYKNRVGVILKK